MRRDENDDGGYRDRSLRTTVTHAEAESVHDDEEHVVFDFTGLHAPDFADLALILTARLQTPTTENVWVRAIDDRTAYVLRALGLDHLFRHYPGTDEIH